MISYAAPRKTPDQVRDICSGVQSHSAEWPKSGSEKEGIYSHLKLRWSMDPDGSPSPFC